MKQFPTGIKFKYEWRKYQKRVLSELEGHLNDDHLHVVAPPGSGKTVLGLEVALRLNKPTLIVAPTLAIRDQWVHRFCELFLQVERVPSWISRNIRNPKFLTVVTYQALLLACVAKTDKESSSDFNEDLDKLALIPVADSVRDLVSRFEKVGTRTIVVDEAHHLKNAWWRSLTEIKRLLRSTIVGLTATPPYDVSHSEWQRYLDLNGPVDAEITVPELVIEGNLCPHQDYVLVSRPTLKERRKIDEHRCRIIKLFEEIKTDKDLIGALENHPIFQRPTENLDWIYGNFEYYAATLIFLNAVGSEVTKIHREVVGDEDLTVPDLDYKWLEILLTFYLHGDREAFAEFETHQESLLGKLKRSGAVERRSVNLRSNSRMDSYLSSSISKLGSIEKIVNFEYDHLKTELRLVILTDYIRKEYLVSAAKNSLELTKMGVMPIFETLRRRNERNIKIGVLTGSLVIVPSSAIDVLREVSKRYGILDVQVKPLPFDTDYQVVSLSEALKRDLVHIVTQVFQRGSIEVLVGTKSLLGEGWDAPSVNSLILASFVGSYVLSNQMRGRAIRTEKGNSDKTSNIWHLVCVDPTAVDRGSDFQLMERRFKAFVGVSFGQDAGIENGFNRLQMNAQLSEESEIESVNKSTLSLASKRDELLDRWRTALETGSTIVEEIKAPFPKQENYKEQKTLYLYNTIRYALFTLAFAMIAFGQNLLMGLFKSGWRADSVKELFYVVVGIGLAGLFVFGRRLIKSIRLYIRYRDISEDIYGIGNALLDTLVKIDVFETSRSRLNVVASMDPSGAVFCSLEGGTTFEKSTFVKSLQEIIEPVENPKYLIIRKSLFLNVSSQRDYHSLPELVGRRKKYAEYFRDRWRKWVGRCELVYVRSLEGRKALLVARAHSLASEFDEVERVCRWR